MSQRALMNACRDLLRLPVGTGLPSDGLGLVEAECECMFDGMPIPICGELFVAIHEGEWSNQDTECRGDRVGVYVTITRRVAYAPYDRGRIPLNDAADALNVLADKIASKLHSNYVVLDFVGGTWQRGTWTGGKEYSLEDTVNGFDEPLRFKGAQGPSQVKYADWFHAEGESEAPLGVARTLIFGEARRYQTIESQT